MTVLARVALPLNPRYETRYDIHRVQSDACIDVFPGRLMHSYPLGRRA
jgi:hypothetical protein